MKSNPTAEHRAHAETIKRLNEQAAKPAPAKPETVTVRNGDPVEVLIDHMWWHATITGCARASVRVRLSGGVWPIADAVLPAALYGKTWRLSTLAVHRVPLTGQGVRNLNMAAPPALRNGRHFRKPRNWIAICPHPDEFLLAGYEEPIFFDWVRFDVLGNPMNEAGRIVPRFEAVKFNLRFRECGDCGAEVPA